METKETTDYSPFEAPVREPKTTVTSRFNKGATIYFMRGEIPMKGEVTGITFFIGKSSSLDGTRKESPKDKPTITYHLEGCIEVNENSAYASKEELIKVTFDKL